MTQRTKRRPKGEWLNVAKSRRHKNYELTPGRGVSNVPKFTDVGSAAYRRLLAKRGERQ